MTTLIHKKHHAFVWLPMAGMILFVVFYIIAAWQYPGGSYAFPNKTGFNFKDNYLCDLLDAQTINGLENTARTYARMALAILCFSLGLFACKAPAVLTDEQLRDFEKLPKLNDKELLDRLDSLSHSEPKSFYSKLSVSYTDLTDPRDPKEFSFKTSFSTT